MKPDWDKLPIWVNWIWIGSSGYWFGGYKKPRWDFVVGSWIGEGNSKWEGVSGSELLEWGRKVRKNSLEARP